MYEFNLTEFYERAKKMQKCIEEYDLTLKDFQLVLHYLYKMIPGAEYKEDGYGNEYYQCSDCQKKFTYRHFDGYCEKCGKRLIW